MDEQQKRIHRLADLVEKEGPMRVSGRIVSDQEKRWIVEGLRYLAAHQFVDNLRAKKREPKSA